MFRISLLQKVRWDPPTLSSRMLIKWWMILRVVIVSTTLAVVWYFSGRVSDYTTAAVMPAVIVSVTAVISLLFYRSVKRGNPPELHYFFHYFIDISLISLINLITLPVGVNFVPLYVPSIAVASILSFRSGAFFTATIASILYLPVGLRMLSLGVTFRRLFEFNVSYLDDKSIFLNISLQIFLFYAIAAITSYLSIKLRSTGSELEDTRRLLRQHRLDTNEILQNIASGLVTCNTAGAVVYANDAAVKILGMTSEQLLGQQAERLFEDSCPDIGRIIYLASQAQIVVTRRTVRLSGAEDGKPLAVSSSLLQDGDGKLRGVSLVFEDISPEIKARQLELRGSRLEAVAELAASLAHEIKNPLASIRSAVEFMVDSEKAGKDPRMAKLMDCILKESDRLTELLKQFLKFASGSLGPSESVNLGQLLEEVRQSVSHHPDWRSNVKVEMAPDVSPMWVMAHRSSLCQVFINLMINAVQAKGTDARQTSRIVIESADRRRVSRLEEPGKSSFHRLCFRDNGPGIEKKVRERIFEPFYTTRKGGFGLGLAVVHRIVNALGGLIDVEDSPEGPGAAFIISLPRARESSIRGDSEKEPEKTGRKEKKLSKTGAKSK